MAANFHEKRLTYSHQVLFYLQVFTSLHSLTAGFCDQTYNQNLIWSSSYCPSDIICVEGESPMDGEIKH